MPYWRVSYAECSGLGEPVCWAGFIDAADITAVAAQALLASEPPSTRYESQRA
jgi:hypothetical protein